MLRCSICIQNNSRTFDAYFQTCSDNYVCIIASRHIYLIIYSNKKLTDHIKKIIALCSCSIAPRLVYPSIWVEVDITYWFKETEASLKIGNYSLILIEIYNPARNFRCRSFLIILDICCLLKIRYLKKMC